jgi:hypothetical protein
MRIPRQRQGARWLFTQPPTYDFLIVTLASVVGFSAAVNYAAQGRRRLAIAVGAATIGVWVFTVVKQLITLAATRKNESIHELEGCLHTLHAVLDPASSDPPVTLRLAIHVPVKDMLEQVTEYIGVDPKPGRRGRQYSANAGIIGKAFRENDVFVAHRSNDDYEMYLQELVEDWNYTPEQARHLNPGVMEWMAVPFYDVDSQRVNAVLYLDASKRDFFTPDRQETILSAVNGIAVFIGKRYS